MTGDATLVDELTGERVPIDGGAAAGDVIDARLAAADHPRADFRSRALRYELLDGTGRALGDAEAVPTEATVTLVGPEAAEIRSRRDRWLADIEARGAATRSVSTSTHLALVERTGSRLHDVRRLREMVEARRAAAPPPPRVRSALTTGALALVGGVAMAAAAVGLGIWFFSLTDDDGTVTVAAGGDGGAAGGADADADALSLPVDLELELAVGAVDRTTFRATEGQNVTILMLAPQSNGFQHLDPQLRLLDADGNDIGYNDDRLDTMNMANPPPGFNFLNSRIDITIPATGTYVVESSDLSGTGSGAYQLLIEDGGPGGDGFNGAFNPNDFEREVFEEEAVPDFEMEGQAVEMDEMVRALPLEEITCGTLPPIEVEVPIQVDVEVGGELGCEAAIVAFVVPENAALLAISAVDPNDDPIIWLRDEAGAIVAANDDAGDLNSYLEIPVEPGTSYELLVASLRGTTTTMAVVVDALR